MREDQTDRADAIYRVLHLLYAEKRERFEQHARDRDTTVEALAAAAVCALLQKRAEQDSGPAGVRPRTR